MSMLRGAPAAFGHEAGNLLSTSALTPACAPARRGGKQASAKAVIQGGTAAVLASLLAMSPSAAETYNGTGQADFDTYIDLATQPGADDTVNIVAGASDNYIEISSDLVLPGEAEGISLNFLPGGAGYANRSQVSVVDGATLTIEAGADVDFTSNGRLTTGFLGETSTVEMTGGSLSFGNADGYSALHIGYGYSVGEATRSSGTFNQSGGEVLLEGSAINIGIADAVGRYTMSGGTLSTTSGSTIYLGSGEGADGLVTITGDARFVTERVGETESGIQIFVGVNEGTGRIVQDGADTLVSIDSGGNSFLFGENRGGDSGGHGTYELRAGTFETFGRKDIVFGDGDGGTGEFIQSGGTFEANRGVTIGRDGTGIYALSGGTATFNDGMQLAAGTGTGTVTQTGGTLTIATGTDLFLGGNGAGTYNLNGGTLAIGGTSLQGVSSGGNGSYDFNLGGGTIQVVGSDLSTAVDAELIAGSTSTIDTNGFDATWDGTFSGSGNLAKAGAGTLILTSANSFTGAVSLQGGTLSLGTPDALGGNALVTSEGATFALSSLTSPDTVYLGPVSGSGTINLGDARLETNVGSGQTASFSGTINSTNWGYDSVSGRFSKTGAGDLIINGSTMNRGESFIVGGSMTQSAGTTTWSNMNVGSGAGANGTLFVSGGSLTLNVGMRVGDYGGTGLVSQTGGTVKLEQTCADDDRCPSLNIGNQGGTGTYTISGGSLILEGGSHTIGRNAGTNPVSSGTLNISGTGLVEVRPSIGRGFMVIGDRDATAQTSTGVINQTGGMLRIVDNSELYLGGYGSGTYNLNGGVLEVGADNLRGLYGSGNTTGSYDFNLGGGSIRVIGSDLSTAVDAELIAGSTSTIDTNGFDATWSGTFSGSGALRKSGAGTLNLLNAGNSYTGGTYLAGGTLNAVEGGVGSGNLVFEASSTYAFPTGYTLANDVVFQEGAVGSFEVAQAETATLSGQLSGAGGLAKAGLGELFLTGANNTYTGPTLVNQGRLVAATSGAVSPLSAVSVADGAVFELRGVTEQVEALEGDGLVELGEGSQLKVVGVTDSLFSGEISGSGGLQKSGYSTLTLTGLNTYEGPTTVDGGTLSVLGTIANSVVAVSAGGTLKGTGKVKSVVAMTGGTIDPGQSPGTLTVANNLTFLPGSTYRAEIEDGVSDNIVLESGVATIEDGANLSLQLTGDPTLGQSYTILEARSGATIAWNDGFTVSSNFSRPLIENAVLYSPTAVSVTYQGLSAPWSTAVSGKNAGAAADAVKSLGLGNPVYDAAVFLEDDRIDRAFSLLTGEINASAKSVLVTDSRFVRNTVFDRLLMASGDVQANGMATAPLGYASNGEATGATSDASLGTVWAEGFGSWGSTNGNSNASSLDRNSSGVFIGADTLVSAWRLGVFGGYSHTNFDVDNLTSSGDSDAYHAGVYAGSSWQNVLFRGGAAYSWSDVSTSRMASLPTSQTLSADYNAGTGQVFGEVGYDVDAGPVGFQPFAGLAYVNLHTGSFTETGGDAALTSESETMSVSYTTLGVRASADFALGSLLARADGMVGWRHAFGDVTPETTYTFAAGGNPFTVDGVPIGKDSFLLDVGLSAFVHQGVRVGVAYSGEFASDASDQSVGGNVSWNF